MSRLQPYIAACERAVTACAQERKLAAVNEKKAAKYLEGFKKASAALKKADVGIAVEGATDAACAAADIVLTEPGRH